MRYITLINTEDLRQTTEIRFLLTASAEDRETLAETLSLLRDFQPKADKKLSALKNSFKDLRTFQIRKGDCTLYRTTSGETNEKIEEFNNLTLLREKIRKLLEGEALADFTETDRESYRLLTKKELPVVPSCELGKMHCLRSLDGIGVPKEKYEEVMKYFIALEFPGTPISCE